MGAGSSASAGPGQYSLDDLLTHLSAEGVLTAAKVIATGDDMRLPLPLDYLQDKGAFSNADTPDAIIALDLDKFREAVQSKLIERAAEQAEAMEEKPADIYRYLTYTAVSGANFTIPSEDFTAPNDATGAKNVFVTFIDKLAGAATENFTVTYDQDRTLFVRVRDGGTTGDNEGIRTFETTATLGSNGGSTTAIRTSDA